MADQQQPAVMSDGQAQGRRLDVQDHRQSGSGLRMIDQERRVGGGNRRIETRGLEVAFLQEGQGLGQLAAGGGGHEDGAFTAFGGQDGTDLGDQVFRRDGEVVAQARDVLGPQGCGRPG